jgi:sulfur relay (sulfurtransferase) complex TusBCD TusD component (DsrE family)
MDKNTVLLFTANGMGDAPQELQHLLTNKFMGLLLDGDVLPAKILFYTDGVKLVCKGSPVLENLQKMPERGVELILCSTCLDYFGLTDQVAVGIVGGMTDIIEAMQKAEKVIHL